MARKQRPPEDTNSWMNTYSDLVTLLLTFFVLLFSMSSVDAEKWQNLVRAFTNPGDQTAQVVLDSTGEGDQLAPIRGEDSPPGQADSLEQSDQNLPVDFNDLYEYLKSYAEEQNMSESVELTKTDSAVFIRFQNNIFFDADMSYLKRDAYPMLEFLGDCLKNVEDELLCININGHTAAVPNAQNYRVSDWALSSERASNIAIYFEDVKGINPQILRPIGYGKNYPVDTNETPEGRENNRRVDMVIISNKTALAEDQAVYQEFVGLFDPAMFPKSGGAQEILIPSNNSGNDPAPLDDLIEPSDSAAPPDDLMEPSNSAAPDNLTEPSNSAAPAE